MIDLLDDEKIWNEFDAIEEELGGDLTFFRRTKRHRRNPHWRRAYCRALSAYFEAVTSWMARYTILFYHPGQLADEERQRLEARLSASERAFHAIDLFTDTAGARSPLMRGSSQWIALMRFIGIRNRLVHPKRHLDLLVSDEDLVCIERADEVIHYLILESFGRCSRALCKRLDEVQRVWSQRRTSNHAMQLSAGGSDVLLDITPTKPLQLTLALPSGG
jgi:hypothetical protein